MLDGVHADDSAGMGVGGGAGDGYGWWENIMKTEREVGFRYKRLHLNVLGLGIMIWITMGPSA